MQTQEVHVQLFGQLQDSRLTSQRAAIHPFEGQPYVRLQGSHRRIPGL